jgi:methyl-accepting chemotaxis protein
MIGWFRRRSLAQQLSLLTLMVIAVIFGAMTVTVVWQVTQSSLRAAEEQLSRDVGLMAGNLEFYHTELERNAGRSAQVFTGMFTGPWRLDTANTLTVGGHDSPRLYNGDDLINLDFSRPEAFSRTTGGVATVFVRIGDDLLRISTSLRDEQGKPAVGTLLDRAHPGYAALLRGEIYAGPARLFGRDYMTRYVPVQDAAGKVIAVLFVGFDYTDGLAGLRRTLAAQRFGATGYAYAMDTAGVLVLHPSLEGKNLLETTDADGQRPFRKLLEGDGGIFHYRWEDTRSGKVGEKLVAYQRLAGWNWVLAAGSFTDEFLGDAYRLRAELAGFSIIGALLIIGLLGWTLKRRLAPLSEVATGLEYIGHGDLTQLQAGGELESGNQNEIRRMTCEVQKTTRELRELVGGIAAAAETLSNTTSNEVEVNRRAREGVEAQQQEIEQLAAAINQMTTAIAEVAKNATATAGEASNSEHFAMEGRQAVEQTVQAIEQLAAEVQRAAGVISALADSAQNIGGVVDVIAAVAGQTNLLALNAAIEAARAGEQGRGFAVVADEVRELAEKTGISTDEIREAIDGLQQNARDAVNVMEAGKLQAQQSVEEAHKAGKMLDGINRSAAKVSEMMVQIAAAAEQEHAVAEDMNKRVVAIHDIAQTTSDNSDLLSQAVEELQRVSAQLNRSVERFHL